MELPCLNDFIQHFILNFHLALQSTENNALNTLTDHDHNDLMNRKRTKTGLHLITLL